MKPTVIRGKIGADSLPNKINTKALTDSLRDLVAPAKIGLSVARGKVEEGKLDFIVYKVVYDEEQGKPDIDALEAAIKTHSANEGEDDMELKKKIEKEREDKDKSNDSIRGRLLRLEEDVKTIKVQLRNKG